MQKGNGLLGPSSRRHQASQAALPGLSHHLPTLPRHLPLLLLGWEALPAPTVQHEGQSLWRWQILHLWMQGSAGGEVEGRDASTRCQRRGTLLTRRGSAGWPPCEHAGQTAGACNQNRSASGRTTPPISAVSHLLRQRQLMHL